MAEKANKNIFAKAIERIIHFFVPKRKASLLMHYIFGKEARLSDLQLVQLALQVPYILRAVRLIAKSVANLPFSYKNDRSKELFEHPNSNQSQMQFLEELMLDLLLFGNAYVYINRVRGVPKELILLEPYMVKVLTDDFNDVIGYEYGTQDPQKFAKEDIIFIKEANPTDPVLGMSVLRSLEYTIPQYVYTKKWNMNLMKQGARPSGALITEEMLTPEQYQRLKEQIDLEFSGSENAGRPLLLDAGLKWQEITINPKELDWLTSLQSMIREIAIAFGIAPELLGDSQNKTYSNFEEARRQLYYNVVLPYGELLVYEFNKGLNQFMNFYVEINYNEIDALAEDRSEVIKQATEAVKAGILTINEARELLGKPKVSGGDQIFMNASMMPMLSGFEELEHDEKIE